MLSPILAEYFDQAAELRKTSFDKLGKVPTESLWLRPNPEKWSTGEHLEHLVISIRAFNQVWPWMAPALKLWAGFFPKTEFPTTLKSMYENPKYKGMSAPPMVVPTPPEKMKIRPTLADQQERLEHQWQVMRASMVDLDPDLAGSMVTVLPLFGRRNVYQWVQGMAQHEGYHFSRIDWTLETVAGKKEEA